MKAAYRADLGIIAGTKVDVVGKRAMDLNLHTAVGGTIESIGSSKDRTIKINGLALKGRFQFQFFGELDVDDPHISALREKLNAKSTSDSGEEIKFDSIEDDDLTQKVEEAAEEAVEEAKEKVDAAVDETASESDDDPLKKAVAVAAAAVAEAAEAVAAVKEAAEADAKAKAKAEAAEKVEEAKEAVAEAKAEAAEKVEEAKEAVAEAKAEAVENDDDEENDDDAVVNALDETTEELAVASFAGEDIDDDMLQLIKSPPAATIRIRVSNMNPEGDWIIDFSDKGESSVNVGAVIRWIQNKNSGEKSTAGNPELPSGEGFDIKDKDGEVIDFSTVQDYNIDFKSFWFNLTKKIFKIDVQSREGDHLNIGPFTIKKIGFTLTNQASPAAYQKLLPEVAPSDEEVEGGKG
jgi:chemotaxis protein histidine kinase CheA